REEVRVDVRSANISICASIAQVIVACTSGPIETDGTAVGDAMIEGRAVQIGDPRQNAVGEASATTAAAGRAAAIGGDVLTIEAVANTLAEHAAPGKERIVNTVKGAASLGALTDGHAAFDELTMPDAVSGVVGHLERRPGISEPQIAVGVGVNRRGRYF